MRDIVLLIGVVFFANLLMAIAEAAFGGKNT